MRLNRALFASAAALFAAGVQAEQYADMFSSTQGNFNLSAIYDSSTMSTNFTLTSPASGSSLGWIGVGTGTKMSGSNMVVMWASGNQLITTQRTASGNNQPTTNSLPMAAIQADSAMTKMDSSGTTFSWVQPGFPTQGADMQKVEMMWAKCSTAPSSSDPSSTLKKHQDDDQITFDLTKPYTGGAVTAEAPATAALSDDGADRSMDAYNRIVIAHLVFMIAGWLVLFPAGVFIARFGRTAFVWFPKHRAVQLTGILVVFIGLFLGIGIMWESDSKQWKHTHHTLGLALVLIAIFQGALGQFGHIIFRKKGVRLQNFLHIIIGITIIPLSAGEMGLGFDLWDWQPSKAANYVIYAWTGFLGLVYIIGMAIGIPKELKADQAKLLKDAKFIDRVESAEGFIEKTGREHPIPPP